MSKINIKKISGNNNVFGDNNNISKNNESLNISNQTKLNHKEKLDLLLRQLYKYKFDNLFHSIQDLLEEINIIVNYQEAYTLTKKLSDDGLIKMSATKDDVEAQIISEGILYCEENSYSNHGKSLITNNYNISVSGSPNTKIISHSKDISIVQNYFRELEVIEKIEEAITKDTTIEPSVRLEIIECLKEIQQGIKANQKPKFAIKSLIDLAGGISSIASWLTTLGQFAGIVPLPL